MLSLFYRFDVHIPVQNLEQEISDRNLEADMKRTFPEVNLLHFVPRSNPTILWFILYMRDGGNMPRSLLDIELSQLS